MVRWYVSFRRPRFLIPDGLQCLFGCSVCLGVLSVWVFCLFGCSLCLGVLPVLVFCMVFDGQFIIPWKCSTLRFFSSNVVNMWPFCLVLGRRASKIAKQYLCYLVNVRISFQCVAS